MVRALGLAFVPPPLKTAPIASSLEAWLVVMSSRSWVVRGFRQLSLWIRDSHVVLKRNALIMFASMTSGRELHHFENL